MTIYSGLYISGDFYRHWTSGDLPEALDMCDQLTKCPYIQMKHNEICFAGQPPAYLYANWEGQIIGEEDSNYRLDLQGKPQHFNIKLVEWNPQQDIPEAAQAGHWAQWQLQFGREGADRITHKKGEQHGYRTKFKGALGGVMIAMNRWVTIEAFKNALKASFEDNRQNGINRFGVLTSDQVNQIQAPTTNLNVWCVRYECNRAKATSVIVKLPEVAQVIGLTYWLNFQRYAKSPICPLHKNSTCLVAKLESIPSTQTIKEKKRFDQNGDIQEQG